MCLPDTAEYWWDVKNRKPYDGPYFVHMPNAKCGHFKPGINSESSNYLNDITCYACNKLIKQNGNIYGLKEGMSPKEQSKMDKEKNKYSLGRCPECGNPMKERVNRANLMHFLGCSNYPKCKHTTKMHK